MHTRIADLLATVDLPDPHAFATAFAAHVDATGDRDVSAAIQRWITTGTVALASA